MNSAGEADLAVRIPGIYRVSVWTSLCLVVAGCIIGIIVPAGLGWDFANFYDAGRTVAAGQLDSLLKTDKGLIAGQPPQGLLDFWGTPISAWLYAPLSHFKPETALVIFKLQNVLAYAAALLVLFFHARGFARTDNLSRWRFALFFSVLVLLYQPFWTVFRVGGQTTATVLLLLCVALALHGRLRYGWSSLLFVAAVMIKPALATGLLFLMLVSSRVFALYALTWIGITGIVSVAVMGWDIQMEFVTKMLTGAGLNSHWTYNSSIYSIFGALQTLFQQQGAVPVREPVFNMLQLLVKICVVITFVYVLVKTRYKLATEFARAHFNFLLAVLFFLLISQTLWEHYLSFLFIPLACLLAAAPCMARAQYWMLGLLVAVLPLQNLIVIHLLQGRFAFDTLAQLLPVLLLKTAPLWLSWIMLLKYKDKITCMYQQRRPGPGHE